MNTPKLLPSLMCVDFSRMAQTLEVFEQCGIDALHVDIMDGEFVPNYALGTDFCRQLRKLTPIPHSSADLAARYEALMLCDPAGRVCLGALGEHAAHPSHDRCNRRAGRKADARDQSCDTV